MKKKLNWLLSNKSGFTIVEVMVSTVILAIFILAASSALKDIYSFTNKGRNQLEAETDLSFAMRYLGDLLKNAGPSFNNIKNNKDNTGQEFFDHLHDVSTSGWSESPPRAGKTSNMDFTSTLPFVSSCCAQALTPTTRKERVKNKFVNILTSYSKPD
jgi:prepilin-type N-terminal cleavage/methylation domain-containing protein